MHKRFTEFKDHEGLRGSREGCFFLAIAVGGTVLSVVFLFQTIRARHSVQIAAMIASPGAELVPGQIPVQPVRPVVFVLPKKDNRVHLESFDYVWNKIRESYWEKDFGGVDWEQAKRELRPRVEKAKNVEEVRKILSELVSRLGKSHYAIIPATTYGASKISRQGSGESGLTFRLADEKILVTAVRPGSDAEKQGVRPGWEIRKAGDRLVSEFLEQTRSFDGVMRRETMIAFGFGNLVTGPLGSRKACIFVDAENREHKLEIAMIAPPGELVKFGNLPNMRIDMESRLLDSNVGYFRFNGFFDPVRLMPAFRKAVKDYGSAEGLVIDIRGNGGGIVGMTMGMASPLAADPAPLGVMKMKGSELKLALFKSAKPYSGKVAILVDEASASASEIYSGGLQDLKIARVFGKRTAGLSLPSTIEKLPNGDGFQYAIANYTSASGKILEGNGVLPDEAVKLTVENLSQEVDPVLKRAIEWIHAD